MKIKYYACFVVHFETSQKFYKGCFVLTRFIAVLMHHTSYNFFITYYTVESF